MSIYYPGFRSQSPVRIKPNRPVELDPSSWAYGILAYGWLLNEGAGQPVEIKTRTKATLTSTAAWIHSVRGAAITIPVSGSILTGITSDIIPSGSISIVMGLSGNTRSGSYAAVLISKRVAANWTASDVAWQLSDTGSEVDWQCPSSFGGAWLRANFPVSLWDGGNHVLCLVDGGSSNFGLWVDNILVPISSGTGLAFGNTNLGNPITIGNNQAGAETASGVYEFVYCFTKPLNAPQRAQISNDPFSILKPSMIRNYANVTSGTLVTISSTAGTGFVSTESPQVQVTL